jgi:hypothetical protein
MIGAAGGGWRRLAVEGEDGGGGGGGRGGLLWSHLPFFCLRLMIYMVPHFSDFCFGDRKYEFLRGKQKAQRRRKNTILRRLCALRKDGARLFAQN